MHAQEAESVAAAHCLVRAQREARIRAPLQLWRQLAQHARNVHALQDDRQGVYEAQSMTSTWLQNVEEVAPRKSKEFGLR